MNSIQTEIEEKDYQHKTLFFFMPQEITFFKKEKEESENLSYLKSIKPYFYWCSGHEFKDILSNNKFLFQYQIYFIENKKIIAGEVVQKWYPKKNNIKIEIMNFIDIWEHHEKILLTQTKRSKISDINQLNNDIKNLEQEDSLEYFSTFAHFTAQSILELKDYYIKQSEERELDLLQKRYWQNAALYYEEFFQNYSTNNKSLKNKTEKKVRKKTTKKTKKLSIKNEKD